MPLRNIDAIVNNGVKFTSLWTMPECSPSRACFFTGRYPLRTGVTAVILPEDLPRAQVSPYEETIPRVLAHAGWKPMPAVSATTRGTVESLP